MNAGLPLALLSVETGTSDSNWPCQLLSGVALVAFGIVHSSPFYDSLQVCHVACIAAESSMLACMAALPLAVLLLLAQSHEHKGTGIIDSLRVSKH